MMVAKRKKKELLYGRDWLDSFTTLKTFILFNMLWLSGALFIVTIPTVTAAFFAVEAHWGHGESRHKPLANFWTALRRYWLTATAVGFIDRCGSGNENEIQNLGV